MVTAPNSLGDPDTIQMLTNRIDARGIRMERYAMEEVWLKNMAYYSGQQHFYIEGGRIWDATPQMPEHKVLYRVNLTRSACLRAAAKILNVHPKFRAIPATDSIKDRNIAEVSERVFRHQLDTNDWDYLVSLLGTMWAQIAGSAFYKVWFDPLIGETDRFYYDDPKQKNVIPQAMLDAAEMAQKDRDGLFEDFSKGDVRIEVATPFAVFHDWTSRDKSVAGCQWMGERHFIDIDLAAERFNRDPSDFQAEETTTGLIQYEEAIAFMTSNMNVAPFSWTTPQDKRGKRCMMVELWERPSRKHKKGRRVVMVGKRIVIDGDNPYAGDRTKVSHLPYVKQDWTPHPGRFWGSSLVEDLTSPQHHLNDARGCLLEFLRIFGRPATFVGTNSGIDPTTMTIEPGGVYAVNEISKGVTHAPTPQLPPDVTNVGSICQSDLLAIASQSEVDGQKLPGQIRSGAGLQAMQEQRDMALSVSSAQALRATRDVGRISLTLGQMFYDQKRTLRYLEDEDQWQYLDYAGADLTNDLVIVGEASILDTTASRKAQIMDAVQVGALQPAQNPEDREIFLAAMKFDSATMPINVKLQARKATEMAIRKIVRDPAKYAEKGYPILPFEDHATSANVLVSFMYRAEFDNLDPFTKSLITMLWHQHDAAMKQAQQDQMAMIQAAKGAPGVTGTASQPSPALPG
jgi:hypothetical protein